MYGMDGLGGSASCVMRLIDLYERNVSKNNEINYLSSSPIMNYDLAPIQFCCPENCMCVEVFSGNVCSLVNTSGHCKALIHKCRKRIPEWVPMGPKRPALLI